MPKDEETQKSINELQMMQQKLQLFAAQKQQFQLQKLEIENALKEVSDAKGSTYKLVGELLVEKDVSVLKKELQERQEDVDLRLKSIEKQEDAIKDKAMDLQKNVTDSLK